MSLLMSENLHLHVKKLGFPWVPRWAMISGGLES